MGETVKAFFTRSCTTASSNKTEKSQENKKKKKTVGGREKEFQRHCRDYHWFGEIRSSIGSCNGQQWQKFRLTFGDLWRQIIGDLVCVWI